MTMSPDQRTTAYDPFGEPMDVSRVCTDARISAEAGNYRETRRAAIVFWALAMLFVGSRIYLTDQTAMHTAATEAAPVQVTSLR